MNKKLCVLLSVPALVEVGSMNPYRTQGTNDQIPVEDIKCSFELIRKKLRL